VRRAQAHDVQLVEDTPGLRAGLFSDFPAGLGWLGTYNQLHGLFSARPFGVCVIALDPRRANERQETTSRFHHYEPEQVYLLPPSVTKGPGNRSPRMDRGQRGTGW
jgi:hypothetical protein